MTADARVICIPSLGAAGIASPLRRTAVRGDGLPSFVPDNLYVRDCVQVLDGRPLKDELLFEKAGPREMIFFDPARTKAAIVTCGGLCPGLNDVIRSVLLELHMNYGVQNVLGIRYGYQGLNPQVGSPPVALSPEMVEHIHRDAGTMLGSSRGNQDPAVMVDFLVAQQINILFCVGGDGTQRGAHKIYEEVSRRGLKIAIVGIPKTIDNDIPFCDQSFGLVTAVAEAQKVLDCAHAESKGVPYGIGLVKLMGARRGSSPPRRRWPARM